MPCGDGRVTLVMHPGERPGETDQGVGVRGMRALGGVLTAAAAVVIGAGLPVEASPGDASPGWTSDGVIEFEGRGNFPEVEVLSDGTVLVAHLDPGPVGEDDSASVRRYARSGEFLGATEVDQTDDGIALLDLDARGDHAYFTLNQKTPDGWYIEIRRIVTSGLDGSWGESGVVRFGAGVDLPVAVATASAPDGGVVVLAGVQVHKFDSTGELDGSFNGDGVASLPPVTRSVFSDMDIDDDGRLAIAGTRCRARCRGIVVRLDHDGTPTTSFSNDAVKTLLHPGADRVRLSSIAWDRRGRLVVGGSREKGDKRWLTSARLSGTTGAIDRSFGGNGWASFRRGDARMNRGVAAVQRNGRVVLVGGTGSRWIIVRFTADGRRDESFADEGVIDLEVGAEPPALASDVAIDRTGARIIVVGDEADVDLRRFIAVGSFQVT